MLDTELIYYALSFGTQINDFEMKITIILTYFRNFNNVFKKAYLLNLRSKNIISCLLLDTDLKFCMFNYCDNYQ